MYPRKKQKAICVKDGGYCLAESNSEAPLCFLIELLLFELGTTPEWWTEEIKDPNFEEMAGNYSILGKQSGLVYLNLQYSQDGIESPVLAKDSFVTFSEYLIDIIERWITIRCDRRFNRITVIYENGKISFHGDRINNPNLLILPYARLWTNEPRYTLLKRSNDQFQYDVSRLIESQDSRLALFLVNDVQEKAQEWIKYIKKPQKFDCAKKKISKYIKYFQSNDWIVVGYRPMANPCDPFNFDTYSDELIAILEQWDKLYKDPNVNEITMLLKTAT